MASLLLTPGDVFWLSGTGSSGNPGDRHRFICLAANPGNADYLVVPICTPQKQSDRTCELDPTDYPALKYRSYVAYHLMREITQKAIDSAQLGSQIKTQPALQAGIFQRVKSGALKSDEAKPRLQKYLLTYG